MGVLFYRLKEKYLKRLSDTVNELQEERKKCIYFYNCSPYYKYKYDLDSYLVTKCDRLNSLYKQADIYTKMLV